jgi:hypothetical protein
MGSGHLFVVDISLTNTIYCNCFPTNLKISNGRYIYPVGSSPDILTILTISPCHPSYPATKKIMSTPVPSNATAAMLAITMGKLEGQKESSCSPLPESN